MTKIVVIGLSGKKLRSKNNKNRASSPKKVIEWVMVRCPNRRLRYLDKGRNSFPIKLLVWSMSGRIDAIRVVPIAIGLDNMFMLKKEAKIPVNTMPPAMWLGKVIFLNDEIRSLHCGRDDKTFHCGRDDKTFRCGRDDN